MKTIVVGKSRKIRGTKPGQETWLNAKVSIDFDRDPEYKDVEEMYSDVKFLLDEGERDEREYWEKE